MTVTFVSIAVPTGTSFRDELVRRFEPWLTEDLKAYTEVLASLFDEVVLYAFDTDDDEGWTILFDPDRVPAKDLAYLAQYVGERLPLGLSEASAREWVKDAPSQSRGTLRSIFLAAQRNLSGSRLVSMKERDGEVDKLTVVTYDVQTPFPDQTLRDLESVVPADVILNYVVGVGQTWNDVESQTWDDVNDRTWSEVFSDLVGYTHFPRPRPL